MTGPNPKREFTCPECGVKFKSRNIIIYGKNGKECPNEHWHTISDLKHHERHGKLPDRRERQQGGGRRYIRVNAQRKLSNLGVGERTDQLTVALQWMLGGYDKLVAQLPTGSQGRALVDGAFGKSPVLCREVLGP